MLIKRPINICVLFAFSNVYLFFSMLKSYSILSFLLVAVCVAHFILFNIMPRFKKGYFTRPEVLLSGRELIIDAFILFAVDVCFYIFFLHRLEVKAVTIVFCVVSSLIVLFVVMLNGMLRILFASNLFFSGIPLRKSFASIGSPSYNGRILLIHFSYDFFNSPPDN